MRYILIILVFLSVGANAQMVIKAHPNYVPFVQANLLLDTYTGAAGAYSLRKVRSAYTGAAIRVRKDTTGQPEQDINFVGNELDTASIKSFLNARSGFIVTWFDQSSNGRNATQSIQANQPRIANLGVIDRVNGKVALFFDGSNDELRCDDLATTVTGEDKPFSFIGVCLKTNENTTGNLLTFGRSTSATPILSVVGFLSTGNDYGFQLRDDANGNTVTIGGAYLQNTQYLVSNYSTGLAHELYSNNVSQITQTYNRGTTTLNQATIGALRRSTISNWWGGNIQEIIFYDSDKESDRAGIEGNVNTYYGIY